ncbi:hypothetical protein TIFTF001_011346 [Ficus carica]|uniref:C2H2-type domain-containing protein n=1 Tax=Ficus carica TaxID=3494 RepID=A0AA87ZRK6_FICCA|nr:hypothetical protein TIFTF001_011346 [Ficus carica]
MDQDQEQRHVCRFCNKSFLSGKVLGGHMRCHGTKNSAKTEKKKLTNNSEKDGERTGYGLRVNPKKSSRLSGASNSLDEEPSSGQDVFCRVCGKGFDSMRALFGHMRHHSGMRKKEEVHCKECGREFESLRALTGHMKCHSEKRFLGVANGVVVVPREKLLGETSRLVRKKRSRRLLRYKISPNCSFYNLSESSSGVELEHDREVEEAAICLLMLSRGLRSWDEFCSVTESSDNNSSPFEAKSPNRALENADGWIKVVKKPRLEKLETFRSSGSEAFFDEKKLSELSEDDFGLETDDEKMTLEASVDAEIERECQDGMRIINSVEEAELDENQIENLVISDPMLNFGPEKSDNSNSKKIEYKCRTCNKIFNSHQALGGHQTIHRTTKNNFSAVQFDDAGQCSTDIPGIETAKSVENSTDSRVTMTTAGNETNSGYKEHKCPICLKVFGSGQALGGHKRAHMARDSEVEADQITLIKQQVCNFSGVLDLGVSVTLGDEEAKTDVQLNSWWAKNDLNHEVLVGLMPN